MHLGDYLLSMRSLRKFFIEVHSPAEAKEVHQDAIFLFRLLIAIFSASVAFYIYTSVANTFGLHLITPFLNGTLKVLFWGLTLFAVPAAVSVVFFYFYNLPSVRCPSCNALNEYHTRWVCPHCKQPVWPENNGKYWAFLYRCAFCKMDIQAFACRSCNVPMAFTEEVAQWDRPRLDAIAARPEVVGRETPGDAIRRKTEREIDNTAYAKAEAARRHEERELAKLKADIEASAPKSVETAEDAGLSRFERRKKNHEIRGKIFDWAAETTRSEYAKIDARKDLTDKEKADVKRHVDISVEDTVARMLEDLEDI